ncbi:MAG: SUMF1/EgtB/PvdO family nonheme iron enzyme [Deltaproteobacteria bacterium]|nr:SUMF1/EgtB/PvdO family nonheme iron enzyme [Deltaproteobacteria bacterium]
MEMGVMEMGVMEKIGAGTLVMGVVLAVSGIVACSVDRSRTADPAEVPTASALGCADGQVVEWRDGAWACATPAAGDYSAFGSCPEAGDKVVGVDPASGEVICSAESESTDTLGELACAGGQVPKWDGGAGEWGCGDDLQTDPETDSLAAVGACAGGQVLEWQGGAWGCGEDDDTGLDQAAVEAIVANSGFASEEALAAVGADVTAVEGEVDAARGGQASLDARLLAMDARMAAMEARLVVLEDALCPPGFTYAPADGYDICTRTVDFGAGAVTDEMAKVGDFWIDRYETSTCPGSGGLGGVSGGDENGGETTVAAACSVASATPQGSITWFQAAQMCANAGKHLCTNAEWQTAASGTPDPGATTEEEECNVSSDGTPAATGSHTDCVSRFGAYDMAGNFWEWVADWHGKDSSTNGLTSGATYGSDAMYDVSPADSQGVAGQDFPAAAHRGGSWLDGAASGAFALNLGGAPSWLSANTGARCCAGGR